MRGNSAADQADRAALALEATRARTRQIISAQQPSLTNITDILNALTGYREMQHNVTHPIERLKSGTRWDSHHSQGLGPVQAGIVMPGGLGGLSRRELMDKNYENAQRILGDTSRGGSGAHADARNYLAAQRILGEQPYPLRNTPAGLPHGYESTVPGHHFVAVRPGQKYISWEGIPEVVEPGLPGLRTYNLVDNQGHINASLQLERWGKAPKAGPWAKAGTAGPRGKAYVHSVWVRPGPLRKTNAFRDMLKIASKKGKQGIAGAPVDKRLAKLFDRQIAQHAAEMRQIGHH